MLTNAHRSLLAVLALLAFAAPASAAEVARIEGGRLDARDSGSAGFCLSLTAGDPLEGGGGSGTCGQAPWRPRRSNLIAWVSGSRLLVAGAVPASVTRAEAELADGRRVGFDTVEGPRYRGRYAGRLRFFLAALPLADPRDEEAGGLVAVRFLDAGGTLQGVAAGDRSGTRVGRRQVLLRERGRGRSITVAAETLRQLVPSPIALDRMEELACVVTGSREGGYGSSSSTICHEPGPNRPDLLVLPEPGCGTVRTVLAGFVGDAVTAVRVKLGSGRVREVRTRTFRDARGGEHRYLATVVPRGEAVRSIAAVGADAGYELGEKPSGLPCLNTSGEFSVFGYSFTPEDGASRPPGGDEQVAVEAEGHRLLVRDAEADRLCAGIDRLAADGIDCRLPPVNGENASALAGSGMVAAVLPTEVARVRLPDGREVPTVEGGYRGRYAGAVRFLLARADVGDGSRIRLLDASGAPIASLPVFSLDGLLEPVAGPVRIAAGRGWRLTAAKYRYGSCVYLQVGRSEPECSSVSGPGPADEAFALVGCTPRLAVLTGMLARSTRAVRAVLRGGRTLRARIVRIPRRVGGGRAWVLPLPRGARVVALRFDDRRVRFPLLPAADQCGYRVHGPTPFGVAEPEVEVIG